MPFINFKPPFIAHRGAKNIAPENTLAAFMKAKDLGATWVEFDCMLTACGEAVVIHDETLERTTNGTGFVIDHPYSYLKTLDAGSWFSDAYAGECVPTLQAVLLTLKTLGLSANIEIKGMPGYEEQTAKKVLSDIAACWDASLEPPLISSFSMPILQCVRQYAPDVCLGLLLETWFPGWELVCDELECVSVGFDQIVADPDKIQFVKAHNRFALSYTVNERARAEHLFQWGVDAVFTDNLQMMLSK